MLAAPSRRVTCGRRRMSEPQVWVIDPERFANEAARLVAAEVNACLEMRARCRLALAGGSTPRPVYEAMADASIDWVVSNCVR